MVAQYVGAAVWRVIPEPKVNQKMVAEFGANPGSIETIRDMLVDWLERVLGDLYADLSQQTGKMARWYAERDADQLLAGKWVQVGWKNSRSGKYTRHPQGRVIEWIQSTAVLHDPAEDTTYYPIFLVAELDH